MVVVFTIIGAVIFGIYYFGVAKPAADALESAKLSVLQSEVADLRAIGTSQAISDASTYSTQIQAAGSESEVESTRNEVNIAIDREQKRKELLDEADTATNGTYYSATGASGTTQVPALDDLSETLKAAIDAKQTKSALVAYESELNSQATSKWRAFFENMLENNLGDNLAMFRNSPVSGGYVSKDNASTSIQGWTWETLSKLKFENASSVEVPIQDTFKRTPTIRPNSKVNIYVYDTATDNMSELWTDVTVRNVIYLQTDIAAIAWTLTDGATTQSYSVNMWETIKAAAAGDPEATAIAQQNYGVDVMDSALSANIGEYDVSVIYVVKVPEAIGEEIARYEPDKATTKEIILMEIV